MIPVTKVFIITSFIKARRLTLGKQENQNSFYLSGGNLNNLKCQTKEKILSVVTNWQLANQTEFLLAFKNHLRLYSSTGVSKLLM